MKHGDAFEAGLETHDGLRGECDFGDEDKGALAALDDGGDGLEIDLGFSAAGDAVEEVDAEIAGDGAREEIIEDFFLVVVEGDGLLERDGRFCLAGHLREIDFGFDGDPA